LDELSNAEKLGLAASPYPTVAELLEDLRAAVLADVVDAHPPVRDRAAFDALLLAADRDLEQAVRAGVHDVIRVLAAWRVCDKALSGRTDLHTLPALTEMRGQLERLVHRGFLGEAGLRQLRHYPRYLTALEQRREKLA